MIRIFDITDTSFDSNGIIVIDPLKAKMHIADNGDYYLDIEVGLEYIDYIVQDMIVVAKVWNGTDQAFRIRNVTQTGKRISARCLHVFFDSMYYSYVEQSIGNQGEPYTVLHNLTLLSKPQSPMTYICESSLPNVSMVSLYRQPLYDGIMQVVQKTNAVIEHNNYELILRARHSFDSGVVIQYGKNIKDISKVENWDDVCTRIYPIGNDGITTTFGTDPEPYLDSQYASYRKKYIKVVTFNQDYIKRESYSSDTAYKNACKADLAVIADKYLQEHAYPEVNYTLKANIEKINRIGDKIEVIDERLGIDMDTYVTSFDYDCLSGQFTEVQFGNFRKTAKGMGLTVTSLADNQANAVLSDKRLKFRDNGSVTWEKLKDETQA
jgi:phage-related protein